ncbi:MAG: VPLPA-CTERM sorting domain-containing protein [Smithella sp.]
MKNFMVSRFLIVGVFFLAALSAGKANAYTINNLFATDSNGGYVSPYSVTATETFDNSSPAWTWLGDYKVVNGNTGINSAPAVNGVKESTNYVTVPNNRSSGSATITLAPIGSYYTYFGLWWGSMDSYNTIIFYKDGVMTQSFTGSDIVGYLYGGTQTANGNQFSPYTNMYVNFLDLEAFNSVRMTSTSYAFEADNLSVGNPVPIPNALWLLSCGLIGLIGIRRRFNN